MPAATWGSYGARNVRVIGSYKHVVHPGPVSEVLTTLHSSHIVLRSSITEIAQNLIDTGGLTSHYTRRGN
jgi:hypothetical protein